jgi:hypothetical protein
MSLAAMILIAGIVLCFAIGSVLVGPELIRKIR